MNAAFVIRDGLPGDLDGCLALDHTYTTDQVWQMHIFQDAGGTQVTFRPERLPRALTAMHTPDARRLTLALAPEQCLLVAASAQGARPTTATSTLTAPVVDPDADVSPAAPQSPPALFGYLTMRYDPARRTAWVHDIVVDADWRRGRIGSRLLKAARRWASEHDARRLMLEIPTRNVPAISFATANGLAYCGYNDAYLDDHDIALFFGAAL